MAQAQKRPGLSQQVLPMAGQAAGAAFTGGSPEGAMVGGMIGTKLAGGDATPTGGSGAADAIARRLKGPQEAPPSDPSQDLAKADAALSYLPPEQQQKYAPIISRARALDAQSAQGGWR